MKKPKGNKQTNKNKNNKLGDKLFTACEGEVKKDSFKRSMPNRLFLHKFT